jgi:hypothetical protein
MKEKTYTQAWGGGGGRKKETKNKILELEITFE